MAESRETSPSDANPDFDDDTLKAIGTVYLEEGNKEYRGKRASNAVSFYTQGIQVKCKDDLLNAKLYSNRATAHSYLGNYQETLNDATAAVALQPTFIKAIERGASACIKLKRHEEATTWCDKGLAIDKNNKTLRALRTKCLSELETKPQNMKSMLVTHTTGQTDSVPKMAKDEAGDNCGEGNSHGNLRNPFHGMEDLKTAIDYYESLLRTAKLVGDKAGEGSAYRYLGIAYGSLKDFKTAIDYHEGHLKTTQELGDKAEEGGAYANLGHDYYLLGDFKTAVEYHEQQIRIAKEVEDRAVEGNGYGRLGKDYEGLGDFKTAIKYHKRCLKIGKEAGDKAIEGLAYVNLGFNYQSLGDFKTAVDCYERSLKIAKEAGDKAGEERAYNNLGAAYRSLWEFETAFDYHQLSLKIAKEVADKAAEGNAYCNLGNVYQSRGDFKTAVDYYERYLNICKEVGDRAGEGGAYNNLGNVYQSQDDFKRVIEYHEHELDIAKEVGSKALKGTAYANLGVDYLLLGYYETSVKYHECHLQIAKELGDRDGEGKGYSNLGIAYQSLGNFEKAFECNEQYLTIAKEIGDKAGEGKAYGNLGFNFHELGDFKTAIDCFKRSVEIAKEVGDRVAEGKSYGHLGRAYGRLGDLKIAIEYHECCIEIAKEVGNKIWAASSFHDLGRLFESQRSFSKAIDCFHSSVTMLDIVRRGLQEGKDEWKISYRNTYEIAYTSLWRLLLKQDKVVEALLTAEQGRSQALNDLMEFNYGLEPTHRQFDTHDESAYDSFSLPPSVSAFIAIDEQAIVFWVVQEGKDVELRKKEVSHDSSLKLNDFIQSLIAIASQEIGVRAGVKCEDRSLDNLRDEHMANERATETPPTPVQFQMNTLKTLYDAIIEPIADLVLGDELILVPEGPLCLAPYAAFVDSNSRYLCDVCRIRVIPSLTSLKLMTDSPAGYHSKTGVLLVGDPWVQEVVIPGVKLEQLPFARKEVQMIGRICNTKPLIGREATKDEVLRRLSSVALIHIAAHGRMETGEIVLAPNTTRTSHILTKEDFFLTMKDVTSAQIRARLVVLSCCHSGRGEIKAEGVVGIARAFLGAGARAVLVTLWAIDDEATLHFMSIFYSHLVKGISASESLNKAMKRMRESDQFNEVKHWAPFVLIGDDVTMEFDRIE